jgi:hypothetical protein
MDDAYCDYEIKQNHSSLVVFQELVACEHWELRADALLHFHELEVNSGFALSNQGG